MAKPKTNLSFILFSLYFPFIMLIPSNYANLFTFLPIYLFYDTSFFFHEWGYEKPKHPPYQGEYRMGIKRTWINITLCFNLTIMTFFTLLDLQMCEAKENPNIHLPMGNR